MELCWNGYFVHNKNSRANLLISNTGSLWCELWPRPSTCKLTITNIVLEKLHLTERGEMASIAQFSKRIERGQKNKRTYALV